MADENKISVNISINGLQQIDQSAKAFDSLRISINNLSQPFNSFSNNLNSLEKNLENYTGSLGKLNTQNKDFASTGDLVGKKAGEASGAFSTWIGVLNTLGVALKGWTVALTGDLAIFTAFLPEIINFATSWFKGKEALDKAKLSLDSLNKGISSTDYSNAIQNVSQLKIKVDLAKKGIGDKEAVIKEYNKTVGQTVGQVKTLDQVETNLKNNSGKYIQAMLYKATAMAAIKEAAENQVKAEKELRKSDKESVDYTLSGLDKNNKLYKANALKNRQAAAKPYEDANKALLAIAGKQLQLEAKASENFPINTIKKRIADLQKQTESGIIGSKVFKELEKLKKELREIDPSVAPVTPRTTKNSKVTVDKPDEKPLPKISADEVKAAAAKKLQQTADVFSKQLDQQHNNYDKEKAALKDQLFNKLITQEEYFSEWQKLQDKYHTGIGETIKLFNERDLLTAQQHQKDLVDAQQQEDLINKDKKDLMKAIIPADKLAAEKKLITDKYDFEIQKAAEAGKSTVALREQYQQEITEATKRHEEERQAFLLETSQKVSDTAFSLLQNGIRSQSNDKLKELEAQKNAELSNTNLTATQKKAIDDKYKKKENEEKVKAFKAEQKASILQAVINGALAVTKAMSQAGILGAFVIPGIIASTAIQVATIAAQKPPKYAKGGLHYQSDGRGTVLSGYSTTDNTNAYLRSGEAVVVSEAMRNPWARNLVSAINVAYGGRDFSVTNPGRGYAIGGIFTEFDLIPDREKSILISDKYNAVLFERLINKTQKVKIHIHRTQHKSNNQLLTQENNIKSKIDSGVSKEVIYNQIQKIDKEEKNKLSSESKTYTALTWWLLAGIGILITVYILNKFNISSVILGFFKL